MVSLTLVGDVEDMGDVREKGHVRDLGVVGDAGYRVGDVRDVGV